jgi:16S rRNA processing protein RimM
VDLDSLRRVGRIGKPWGHRGELTLHLEAVDPEDIEHHGSMFIEIQGQRVPFFFSSLRENGRDTLIKFDEVDDPQAASILVGRDVLLPPGLLADGSDESWDPDELIGLRVVDEEHGELGEVAEIGGTRENPVMVIQHGAQEVMVPVADEMIVSLDVAQGTITVRTPPGLVELYRGGK